LKKEHKLIFYDTRKRKFLKKNWLKKQILFCLLLFTNLVYSVKQRAAIELSNVVFKLAARSFYHDRCLISGRGYSVNRSSKLSRFSLRVVANAGFIHGLKRSSW